MPTMQNRTVNAAAVTWNDPRFHSAGGARSAAIKFAELLASCIAGVRICAVTWFPVAVQILNLKMRLFTNLGMLKIFCLEVDGQLHSMHLNSLNGSFTL